MAPDSRPLSDLLTMMNYSLSTRHPEQALVSKKSRDRKWKMDAFKRRRSSSGTGTVVTVEDTIGSQNSGFFVPHLDTSVTLTNKTVTSDEEYRGCLKHRTQYCSLKQPYRCATASSKSVTFGRVEIHEHEIQLGDNPSVSKGPPITLQWRARQTDVISVEEYEQSKPPSRCKHEMLLPRFVREDMLRHQGYSRSELKEAVEAVKKIQENRSKSAEDGKIWQKLRRATRFWKGDDHTMDLAEARNLHVDEAF